MIIGRDDSSDSNYILPQDNLRIGHFRFSLISSINAQASQESIDIISIDPKQEFQTHNA